jgi:hypothetical protein
MDDLALFADHPEPPYRFRLRLDVELGALCLRAYPIKTQIRRCRDGSRLPALPMHPIYPDGGLVAQLLQHRRSAWGLPPPVPFLNFELLNLSSSGYLLILAVWIFGFSSAASFLVPPSPIRNQSSTAQRVT